VFYKFRWLIKALLATYLTFSLDVETTKLFRTKLILENVLDLMTSSFLALGLWKVIFDFYES
jgi:hypothetical protein